MSPLILPLLAEGYSRKYSPPLGGIKRMCRLPVSCLRSTQTRTRCAVPGPLVVSLLVAHFSGPRPRLGRPGIATSVQFSQPSTPVQWTTSARCLSTTPSIHAR